MFVVEPGSDWMLAIDTSSDIVSLALVPVGEAYGLEGVELRWNADRHQTTTLLAQIDHARALAGLAVDGVSAIAVATGPGSFNALRVGLSVAKGLAFALGIPILGVGTLDAAAHGVSHWKMPVRAFVAAGRGRVVSADFRWTRGSLRPRGEMTHRTIDELASGLIEPTILVGDLSERDAVTLRQTSNVMLPRPDGRRRRATSLVDLAVPRWRAGEWDDIVTLEPIYVHSRPAETKGGELG